MRLGVAEQLLARRRVPVRPLEVAHERRILGDLRLRSAEALAVRGDEQVVALPPVGEHRASGRVVRPGEPGDEQQRCAAERRSGAAQPRPALQQRGGDHEGDGEDEDGADERERPGERARRGPPAEVPAAHGARVREHAGQDEERGELLGEQDRHVVLRERVERVHRRRREADARPPPVAHGEREQQRPEPEEERLSDQRKPSRDALCRRRRGPRGTPGSRERGTPAAPARRRPTCRSRARP